ncbi:Regenerating islet-derived protein 4 [Myotis davidii]|uniref:Regenerating islet-derived protein 4 n=1 Tax=Myotis davidii TaxID=225400 RepID=L5LZG6_MYODS|nr:Regenerating islet-derived protein 4 [Myotis davidii]
MASKSVWLLLLVASTGALGDILMRPSCATGWFFHKSHCYGYFRKLRNWSDAELECQSFGNGAHLASIQNLQEAKTISKYIGGYQRNLPVWIGLHDPQKSQQWRWIDGTSYLFKTWSGRSMAGNKHCAEMNAHSEF